MNIERTDIKYLDGIKYVRVYWADSNLFEDIDADIYEEWKEELGHSEEEV